MNSVEKAIRTAWKKLAPKPFDPKKPVVKLHEATYGAEEIAAVADCLLNIEVTMGPRVRKFEGEFSKKYGHAHAVMCNSGSSANLLAIAALANPVTKDRLKPGDEVIVPALCWSTTVWPLIQMQLVPVIVDIDIETLNVDLNEVERAISPRTRALMIVPIYGNPCDMDGVLDLCKRRNLHLIEDSCESLGATYKGRHVGSFGRIGQFSFYYSHHITTLEGGMVVTDDAGLAETLRVLRAHGWVREMQDPREPIAAHPDIDPKFLFVNLGYNLRATEPQGAMGSLQLKKLEKFIRIRRDNAAWFRKALAPHDEFFGHVTEQKNGRSSWFGYPMRVKKGAPFTQRDVIAFLRTRGLEMRPLNAGNIAGQPAMKLYEHRVVGDLPRANEVWRSGFTFGNHQHVDRKAREYIVEQVNEFVRRHRGRS